MSTSPAVVVPTLRRDRVAELSAMIALFWLTIRQHLHGRRMIVLGLLYLLPCALAITVRSLNKNPPIDEMEFALMLNLLPHGLAPLTALLYASGIISDEVEEQTLTYLLLRSLPRWALYVGKMLATMLVTTVLVALGALALHTATHYNTPDFVYGLTHRMPRIIGIFALAQAAYCALFGFVGLVTRRSLIFGFIYIAAVEGILASMDFVLRSFTVAYYVRSLLIRWAGLPEGVLRETVDAWALTTDKVPMSGECVLRLAGFAVIAIAFAAWWFSRREYRVKTPGQ